MGQNFHSEQITYFFLVFNVIIPNRKPSLRAASRITNRESETWVLQSILKYTCQYLFMIL